MVGESDGKKLSAPQKATCKSLIDDVDKAIGRWDKSGSDSSESRHDRAIVVEFMLRALCDLGVKEETKTFLAKVCAAEKNYDLHKALIPATTRMMIDPSFAADSSRLAQTTIKHLRQNCLDRLKILTESEPQPPADWKRSANVGCNCDDCKEVSRFLRSKTDPVLRLARKKENRKHLHRQIDTHRIDCTHVTERVGRPYTLVLTKNQATYTRALRQYQANQKILAALDG